MKTVIITVVGILLAVALLAVFFAHYFSKKADNPAGTSSEQGAAGSKKIPLSRGEILKALLFFGITFVMLLVFLTGVVWVLERGPSPYITEMFCRSTRETSALRWMPGVFLTDEEEESFRTLNTEDLATEEVNSSLIHIANVSDGSKDTGPALEIVNIAQGTLNGKLMIVKDPARVKLGISGDYSAGASGLLMVDLVAKYDAIGGVNAGGFVDVKGRGDGSTPQGLVIYDGEIVWGSTSKTYSVIGLDKNHILRVGNMTAEEAMAQDLEYGVSFVSHDGQSSSLIINGEVQTQNLYSGVNPRTAIGQREDGAILLLVLDGRSINTLGASMSDIVDIMLSYGAVNCANLDGGGSSLMIYEGEIINTCSSVTGPRPVPNGFVVLREEND